VPGGGADVAALGVEHHRHLRVPAAQPGDQAFELVLGAGAGEIGDLRLEGAGVRCGGVGDRRAEGEDRVVAFAQVRRKAARIGSRPTHSRESALCQRDLSLSMKVTVANGGGRRRGL